MSDCHHFHCCYILPCLAYFIVITIYVIDFKMDGVNSVQIPSFNKKTMSQILKA